MGHKYKANDSLAELISDDFKLLQVLSRFGIALGFGDKCVEQVCKENNVDTDTFIAVCNFISQGVKPSFDEFTSLNVGSLLTYLRNSHNFFLDFMLPSIRREFVDSVDCSTNNEIGFLILKFFDDYVAEIAKHQNYESEHFFNYVEGLLQGKRKADICLANFESDRVHKDHDKLIAQKMSDLKKMGFPEEYLLGIYRRRNQKIAWKMSNAINSPILFDTDELEKLRRASCVCDK